MTKNALAKLERLAGMIEVAQHDPVLDQVTDQLADAKKAVLEAIRRCSPGASPNLCGGKT